MGEQTVRRRLPTGVARTFEDLPAVVRGTGRVCESADLFAQVLEVRCCGVDRVPGPVVRHG